jgi:hypothetical protein
MSAIDRALRILNEEFDAFILLGSMYNPLDGETKDTRITRGNTHIVQDLIREESECTEWVYEEEDEDDG